MNWRRQTLELCDGKIGFALTGSFCTLNSMLLQMKKLKDEGADVYPIMSETVFATNTRFGDASYFIKETQNLCGHDVIATIKDAEPIGPKKMFDLLIIAPCTGNTLAKLATGVNDSSVTMAAKAHLRNGKPLLLFVSTNDGLSAAAKNIGTLLNCKNVFFTPFAQDDFIKKPNSLVGIFDLLIPSAKEALNYNQIQPIIYQG